MVDQIFPKRPTRVLPFTINPNLSLVEIFNILQEQIKEENGFFYGTIYDTQVNTIESSGEEFPKTNWSGEIGAREPEQRKSGSPLFPKDKNILPSDFSQFLASIFQKLLDYDNFKKLWDSLDSEDQLNKDLEYLQNILIVEANQTTFPTEIDKQREITNILKTALLQTIAYEEKEKRGADETLLGDDKEEISSTTSAKGITLPVSGSAGQVTDSGESDQESGVDEDEPQPTEKIDQEKKQVKSQKLSSNVAFIYNHLAFDLAQIYGVDQQYFLNIDEDIRAQITEQIITNVHATDPQKLASQRFKIEQEVLQQILIYNQTLSFKIQAHLLKEVPHRTVEEQALYHQLEERIKAFNQDNSFTTQIEALNQIKFQNYSEKELTQISDLSQTYQIQTLTEVENELIAQINETNPELLNNPANIANLNKLIDIKVFTKQSRQDVLADKNLLAKAGVSVSPDQEDRFRKNLADQVDKKRAALSFIIGSADPYAQASSLTVVDGKILSGQQKLERENLESQLFSQKKDYLALHVAYHLSKQSVISRRDQLLAEIQRQELETDFYNQVYAESQNLNQSLSLADTMTPSVFDAINAQGGSSLANGMMSSKTTQSMMDSLGKAAQLNPYLRALMVARAHWQEIVAAILFLIYMLTKLLALLLGAAIVLLLPGGIIWTALLGKDRLITIGTFSANFFSSAFRWVKGQAQSAWGSISSVGGGISKGVGGFLSNSVAKISGVSTAQASGAILESGTLSTVAVGGAVATTAVSSLIAVGTLGAFLQPDPAIIDEEEYSKYVSVSKRANVSSMENEESKDIIYSFSISPKENYVITPILMNPVDKLSFLGGESLDIQAPVDCVIEGIGTEPISNNKRFTCTLEGVSGTDVMMINTFIFNFTVEGVEGTQTIKSSASTKIGNPKLGCFIFGEGGLNIHGYQSKPWTDEEMLQFESAFSIVADNSTYIENLCGGGDITLYRFTGSSYGGIAFSVDVGDTVGIWDLGVVPGAMYSTRYTIIHEFGHVIAYRNAELYQNFDKYRNTKSCYSYDTIVCGRVCAKGEGGCADLGVFEAFPEAITIYVNWETFSSIHSSGFDLKKVDPGAYDYLKEQVFGGIEYY